MRRQLKTRSLLPIALLAVIGWGIFALLRPTPTLEPHYAVINPISTKAVSLPWPDAGQGAIGAVGFGVLATNGSQTAVPMASVAKIVTALAVLKQKPLVLDQQGPTITLDDTDVSYYQSYVSQGGSVAKVVAGETLSEYQALQTMILPSANNMAESLSRWAFGSPDAYIKYANQYVQALGMTQTTVADASGFAPQTVSSAKDLVQLGLAAMNDPVLAQIVSQSQASEPVVGNIKNTNWLLGSDGFVGIKTGNTDQAGGCYLFASDQTVGLQTVRIIGAVMGMPTLADAVNGGLALVNGAKIGFTNTDVVKAGQVVGGYKEPWGGNIPAVVQSDLSVLAWQGSKLMPAISLNELDAPVSANTKVGSVSVFSNQKTASVPVVINQAVTKPGIFWRLFHL